MGGCRQAWCARGEPKGERARRRRRLLVQHMAVIGVGLIGGSLALAAKRRGLVSTVVGCGRSAQNLQVACDRKLIDVATHDPGEAVKAAELVVLAVPLGQWPA